MRPSRNIGKQTAIQNSLVQHLLNRRTFEQKPDMHEMPLMLEQQAFEIRSLRTEIDGILRNDNFNELAESLKVKAVDYQDNTYQISSCQGKPTPCTILFDVKTGSESDLIVYLSLA